MNVQFFSQINIQPNSSQLCFTWFSYPFWLEHGVQKLVHVHHMYTYFTWSRVVRGEVIFLQNKRPPSPCTMLMREQYLMENKYIDTNQFGAAPGLGLYKRRKICFPQPSRIIAIFCQNIMFTVYKHWIEYKYLGECIRWPLGCRWPEPAMLLLL